MIDFTLQTLQSIVSPQLSILRHTEMECRTDKIYDTDKIRYTIRATETRGVLGQILATTWKILTKVMES